MLAQVVVADAGVRREHGRRGVLPLLRRARRDEHAAVAEPARVEDRGDLADDLLLAQRGHALEHRRLVAADGLGQRGVGPLHEGQLGLDAVEQLRVEVVHAAGSYRAGSPVSARSSTLSAARGGRLFRMRARRLLPHAPRPRRRRRSVATGCFESKVADTTISGEITIGQGSSAQTVNPATGGRHR